MKILLSYFGIKMSFTAELIFSFLFNLFITYCTWQLVFNKGSLPNWWLVTGKWLIVICAFLTFMKEDLARINESMKKELSADIKNLLKEKKSE